MTRTLACILIGALAGALPAFGQWHPRNEELPGMVSGAKIAALAAAGGGAVVTLLILKRRGSRQGLESSLQIAPLRLDFGRVSPNQSADQVIVVANSTSKPLTIRKISVAGQAFSLSADLPQHLVMPPGSRQEVKVRFEPQHAGRQFRGAVEIEVATHSGKPRSKKVSLAGRSS